MCLSAIGALKVALLIDHDRLSAKQGSMCAPSGIAQLRKTSDQTVTIAMGDSSDAMNLDDFIFSDNISTPAGLGMSPSPELSKKEVERTYNAVASAIPIKMRKETSQFSIPQSVPVPHHNPRTNEEFNYVQRHVRKTSIDERRVSYYFFGFLIWVAFSQAPHAIATRF
jgi:GATA-binding protein